MSSHVSDIRSASHADDATAPLGLAGLFGLAVFLVAVAVVAANLLMLPVVPV